MSPSAKNKPAESAAGSPSNPPPTRKGDPTSQTDHLIPHANHLLATALKYAWHSGKFLVKVAIRIPGWFVRATRHHKNTTREKPAKTRDHINLT